jgi:signal transduction histidine kinase
MRVFVLISMFFIFINYPAYASVDINDNETHFIYGSQLECLKDPSRILNIEDIIHSKDFDTLDQPIPNFGQTRSIIWLKLRVTNNTPTNILLEIGNPLVNNIHVYTIDNKGKIQSGFYGNHQKFSSRYIPTNTHLIDPHIFSGESKIIYIRLESVEPLEAPITIGTIEAFYSHHHKLTLFDGVYFGFIFLMFLYNLILYFLVKDKLYLYYVFYVLCMTMMMAHFKGYTFEFLWPETPQLNNYFSIIYTAGILSGILFSINFLKTKHYNPVFYKISFVFFFMGLISVITSLMGFPFESNIIEMTLGMAGCFYLIIIGIAAYIKGNKTARYYIVAFNCLIIGALATLFYYLNIVPYNLFSVNAVLIGSGLELLFLSLALADKINSYKAQITEGQKMIIAQLKENELLKDRLNRDLESMVKERTKELQEKSKQVDILVYKASHDIKGPLRSIVGLTKLGMTDLKDSSKALEYMQNIYSASSKVTETVTDLLNLAKLKQTTLSFEPIEVEKIIQEIILSFENLPEYKRLNINLEVDKELKLISDKKSLFSIIQNMIENSIKYSDPLKENSYLRIEISKNVNQLMMKFEDNGIGIAADKQEKIFEMFYKVNEASIGSGIGLYLVKETIQKLGGQLKIVSQEGKGSAFTVSIPIVKPQNQLAKHHLS